MEELEYKVDVNTIRSCSWCLQTNTRFTWVLININIVKLSIRHPIE